MKKAQTVGIMQNLGIKNAERLYDTIHSILNNQEAMNAIGNLVVVGKTGKTPEAAKMANVTYHNKRDSKGRFAKVAKTKVAKA